MLPLNRFDQIKLPCHAPAPRQSRIGMSFDLLNLAGDETKLHVGAENYRSRSKGFRLTFSGWTGSRTSWIAFSRLHLEARSSSPCFWTYSHAARETEITSPMRFSTSLFASSPVSGIRREGKHRGSGQVTGLTFHEVQFLVSQISKQGVRGVRDAALFSLMSDCLLRVGELVKVRPRDITPIPDGSGRLQIHQSKSDQEGRGATLYVGAPTMEYIRDWMTLIETQFGTIDEQVGLFRSLRRGGVIQSRPITPPGVRKNLKAYAKEAGFQGRFSGHSFRVGTAQSLAQKGATLAQMQTVGRWKSPQMPAVYCRNELAGRSAVVTLLYNEPPRKANTESEVQERPSP